MTGRSSTRMSFAPWRTTAFWVEKRGGDMAMMRKEVGVASGDEVEVCVGQTSVAGGECPALGAG